MSTSTGNKTLGQISIQLGVPMHRLEYAVNSRKIPHVARIGRYRVYDAAGIKAISKALHTTKSRSEPLSPA